MRYSEHEQRQLDQESGAEMDRRAGRVGTAIPAVAERADFGPAYNGEEYVTLTFRVPKDIPAMCGIFDITPRGPGTFPWAEQKNPIEE